MRPVSSAIGMNSAGEIMPRVGMVPPQQRFETADFVALQIDQRLIVQFEFAVRQRLAQIHLQLAPLLHARVHLRLEEPIRAASVGLGTVQRHVRILQSWSARRHRTAQPKCRC